jgi:hypothetical protein
VDKTFRNLLVLIALVVVLEHVIAFNIVARNLESWWWFFFMVFMGLNMMFACAAHTLKDPAFDGVYFGRLYLRFKISHTWLYTTDRKGHRHNTIFSVGFIEKDGINARCWNLTCLTFSFSIGILPKRNAQ